MKTAFLSVALMVITVFASAQKSNLSFVITNTDTIYCQKITVGLFNTKFISNSGQHFKVNNQLISQYSINGKLMQKMPVYNNNKLTKQNTMMELITCYRGVKVYKYNNIDPLYNNKCQVFSVYYKGEYVNSLVNPGKNDIRQLVLNYGNNYNKQITAK